MSRLPPWWKGASAAEKLGLAMLAVGLLGVGAGAAAWPPIRARAAALEARRAGLQRELAEASAAVAELRRSWIDMVEIEARLEQLRRRLPLEREIPALYRALYAAAAETGLAVGLFQPGDPRLRDHYTEIPIALVAHGTYHRLGRFLARVAALSRVVTVESLKLASIEHPGLSLRAEMVLTTYVYRSAASPGPGVPAPGMAPTRPR